MALWRKLSGYAKLQIDSVKVQNTGISEITRSKEIIGTVCPSSSFLTGAVHINPDHHPFHIFSKDEVNYSINCDDIMITGRNLKEEYDFCKKTFRITNDEIKRINLNAAKSSFLEEDEKAILIHHLKTAF